MMSESATPSRCMAMTSFTPNAQALRVATSVNSRPASTTFEERFTIHLPCSLAPSPGSSFKRSLCGLENLDDGLRDGMRRNCACLARLTHVLDSPPADQAWRQEFPHSRHIAATCPRHAPSDQEC